MIVASIEQIGPLDREWVEQCQRLRGAESLPAMVWVALQMGLEDLALMLLHIKKF